MVEVFDEFAERPSLIKFVRVNVNQNPVLEAIFVPGSHSYPMFQVYKQGQLKQTQEGGFRAELQNLIWTWK